MLKAPKYSLRVGNDIFFNPLRIGESMEKMASAGVDYAPEVAEYASTLKPVDGKMFVLINAMGAYEYWGVNINGDAFKEEEFVVKKRHQTFVTHGHPYRNHVNKDPNTSYGKILFAAYNTRMHRVELICEFDMTKASDICERIARGEDVRVSMGCRVKYDICTICGKQSKVQEDYCDHLKYHMREILPDGRVVGAINPDPVFFDISVVWIPADRAARVLCKIAQDMTKNIGGPSGVYSSVKIAQELGFREDLIFNKQASLFKLSEIAKRAIQKKAEIEKTIEGEVIGQPDPKDIEDASKEGIKVLREDEVEIPNAILDRMATSFPMDKIMASLGMLGIIPKPREFQRMMLISIGDRPRADRYDTEGVDFSGLLNGLDPSMASAGPLSDIAVPQEMSADSFIPELIRLLGSNIANKSYYAPPAARRLIKIIIINPRTKIASRKPMIKSASDLGYLTALALAYLAAKSGTLKKLEDSGIGGGQVDKLFQKYPELITTLLATGGAMAPSVMRAATSGANSQGKSYPSDYLYAKGNYQEKEKTSMRKVAFGLNGDLFRSQGFNPQQSLVAATLVPQIATHLGKGYVEAQEDNQMRRGERPDSGFLADMIKKYPGYIGLGLSALGLKYGAF